MYPPAAAWIALAVAQENPDRDTLRQSASAAGYDPAASGRALRFLLGSRALTVNGIRDRGEDGGETYRLDAQIAQAIDEIMPKSD